jgi:hypothetical protein
MMPKTGSTVCLRFPYDARPARVFADAACVPLIRRLAEQRRFTEAFWPRQVKRLTACGDLQNRDVIRPRREKRRIERQTQSDVPLLAGRERESDGNHFQP